ncbi:hypothetical protein [Paenibacillus sp. JCM 10914]|uniref:hypothetical protein n=1 Tax=Paenibacillus sp. JCM 10914 TaxID=1236974 RepID=UPI0003CCA181|nr:hypothetical protein [Paenibacillus sp. JCM 10914]GAE06226.1 hypothetical protein JCM10914_2373 [Paenibacillus sp. JCM 10914]
MKVVFSRLLVAVMIFTLIGGTAAEAAGIQSEPSLADSMKLCQEYLYLQETVILTIGMERHQRPLFVCLRESLF